MPVRRGLLVIVAVAVMPFLAGCDRDHVEKDTALQTALEHVIAAPAPVESAPVWSDVQAFYAQRASTPAWVQSNGVVAHESDILMILGSADAHGLDARNYGRDAIAQAIDAVKPRGREDADPIALASLDVSITSALFALGDDVALGRMSPSVLDRRWKALRARPDLASALESSLTGGNLVTWLDRVRPQHVEYARLEEALKGLEAQREKGGWQKVPNVPLKPGQTDPAVIVLRGRLAASGQLTGAAAESQSPTYDEDLVAAVKAFQEHYSLKPSGIADAGTIAAMNVPLEDRINQISLNLERWRWMPDDFGSRYFFVNIPAYHVVARENGTDVLEMRVIVGKPETPTPVFSATMTTVVFSPYWNIPDAIAEGETVPAVTRDPDYLQRMDIEIRRVSNSGTTEVNPDDVDWGDEGALRSLMFRQRPGAKNALGQVKFLFPNNYDVYLHDTPTPALFARTTRAFSHGCVRVEEPETLAKYVLRGDSDWDEPKILRAMNAGVEKGVRLRASIPVHIVYFTATVDNAGGLHLLNDIYGFDRKQRQAANTER